jgi:GTP cyclohydrolase II
MPPTDTAKQTCTKTTMDLPRATIAAAADLPTAHGSFRIVVFRDERTGTESVAMVAGDVWGRENVTVRLHSECLTGDIMSSLRCDCREQLEAALAKVGAEPPGVVLYMRQEGRGIGLANKIRAYALQQERGLDTVDANIALGFRDDEREYSFAVSMLRTLGVRSVRLLTNNPDKILQLRALGLPTERVAHAVKPGAHNASYLATKARRSGHMLEIDPSRADDAS